MKHYGLSLAEGSEIQNITVPTGTSYPAQPNAGELFFRTDLGELYYHDGTSWNSTSSSALNLNGLSDVDITNVAENEALIYSSGSWKNVKVDHARRGQMYFYGTF
jgi:hypothetical protein